MAPRPPRSQPGRRKHAARGGPRATGTEPGLLVALVVDPGLAYDRDIARGVAEYAREVGDWRLYIEEEPSRRLPSFDAWRGQGIISSFDDPEIARSVIGAGLPVVAVGGEGLDPSSGIPFVATDNDAIGRLAAEHLLERALPRFGFYGLPATTTVWCDERNAAFTRRIEQAGRPCTSFDSRHESTHWALLQHDLAAWLASLPRPVGIMACDDVRGRHVLEACRSR